MDPRAPFSFTHLLNDDDVQQNPPQQPSFPQFSQTQQFSQYSQLQPFPQFHQQGPSFPQFGQFPSMPQFSQPQPAFDAQQWQQFLQWQQYQKTSQMHQTQFLPTQEHVESPSKGKATKKMKKPSKMANENDEQPTKTSRQKWPQSDEVLLAQAMISTSENPITSNNQNVDAFWSKIEKYYNESQPSIPRDAHNLRSHWHMFKSKLNRFNELFLQVKSRYRSGWSDDQYIQEARQLYINDPSNKTAAAFTYEHVWNVVKEHGKYNSATHIHGFQPPKRTKTSSSGAYTSSASDANFGENPEIAISLEDIDKEDFEVQLQQVTTTRPIGRDKAKAKLKEKARIEPSEYDLRKLKLIDEISSTNRAKCEAIEKFEHRIDKFYEIEKKKLEMKQKKTEMQERQMLMQERQLLMQERQILFLDTANMNPFERAEHEAICEQIRKKYGSNRHV
ncbi:hypothetical protein E3N88_34361 [Mikania micrantha]|uniref:No apical meristem-associated C-terminal domain-containing protein n=1 Tax=Mikania micrantha TaxID=192012 RepID=A0A5N6LY65_9ASTR|nr:hypothetical protein E3N88_34361 [Mikania micrantha]